MTATVIPGAAAHDRTTVTEGPATGFYGRDRERRELDAAIERAMRFDAPQFVTVVGAAGAGKSRLLHEWVQGLTDRSIFRVIRAAARRAPVPRPRGFTPPERFELMGAWLRARLGLDPALDRDTTLQRFRAELQSVFNDRRVAEIAAFMGPFLGFELPESPLAHALADRPDQYNEVARAVLARFLEEDARITPTLVAIDDLDAGDDASLQLLAQIWGELAEAPLVVVATARPDLYVRYPEWGRRGGSHAIIQMDPLSPTDMTALVSELVAHDRIAARQANTVIEDANGRPGPVFQFVERQRAGAYWTREGIHTVDAEAEATAVTPSHLALLSAAERDLLARATAFGSAFWTGGVIALGRMGGAPPDPTTVFAPDPVIEQVRGTLSRLAERGYVERLPESSVEGETEWTFCHPVERGLLAGTVDPELQRRRRLFAAQWLEGRTPHDQISTRFELLGNLYEDGGDTRRAGECFVAAGDRARDQGRMDTARSLYLRGTRLLGSEDAVFKLDALHKLGDVAARAGRSREALAHFAQMLTLAWRLDLPAKGGAAHARIGRLHRGLGNYRLAFRHLELGRLLFDLAADAPGVAACLDDVGRVHMLLGDTAAAMKCHRQALRVREELDDPHGKILTLSWLGLCELSRGDLVKAEHCFKVSLELSRHLGNARGIAFGLMDLAVVEREHDRPDRARALLEESRSFVRTLAEPMSEVHLGIQIGECLLQSGCPRDAERELEAARSLADRFGVRRLVSHALRGLGECKLATGDLVAARDLAESALRLAEKIEVPALIGAALRLMACAEVRGAPGDADRGGPRELFDRAVDVLSARGAELELGRTLDAYAAFEDATGRPNAAWSLRDQAAGIRARAWTHQEVGLFDRL